MSPPGVGQGHKQTLLEEWVSPNPLSVWVALGVVTVCWETQSWAGQAGAQEQVPSDTPGDAAPSHRPPSRKSRPRAGGQCWGLGEQPGPHQAAGTTDTPRAPHTCRDVEAAPISRPRDCATSEVMVPSAAKSTKRTASDGWDVIQYTMLQ